MAFAFLLPSLEIDVKWFWSAVDNNVLVSETNTLCSFVIGWPEGTFKSRRDAVMPAQANRSARLLQAGIRLVSENVRH